MQNTAPEEALIPKRTEVVARETRSCTSVKFPQIKLLKEETGADQTIPKFTRKSRRAGTATPANRSD